MEIGQLRRVSLKFRRRLQEIKYANPPDGFSWYGYDILNNLIHLDELLSGPNRDIFSTVGNGPILDVGAADGDFAFLLESIGKSVEIIDLPTTNWNGLRGAYQLKELLDSKVLIHEIDVDGPFELSRQYGLVLFLGILYHLRNPLFALEKFARYSKYLMLSSRVARFGPDGKISIDSLSVGYFLDPDECNKDATNWWIFSRPGLRKVVRRAGWEIVEERSVGEIRRSDPVRPDRDERMFLLLKSRFV